MISHNGSYIYKIIKPQRALLYLGFIYLYQLLGLGGEEREDIREGNLEGDDARRVGGYLVLRVEEDEACIGEIGGIAWEWKIVEVFDLFSKEIFQQFIVGHGLFCIS